MLFTDEARREARQGFGDADEQKPPGLQPRREVADDAARDVITEIEQDVPTQDDVAGADGDGGLVEQVDDAPVDAVDQPAVDGVALRQRRRRRAPQRTFAEASAARPAASATTSWVNFSDGRVFTKHR